MHNPHSATCTLGGGLSKPKQAPSSSPPGGFDVRLRQSGPLILLPAQLPAETHAHTRTVTSRVSGHACWTDDVKEYDEDIEEYEDDIEEHEDDIEEHEDDIEEHEDDIEEHEDDIEEHEDDIEEHEDDIEEHEDDIEEHEDDIEEHELIKFRTATAQTGCLAVLASSKAKAVRQRVSILRPRFATALQSRGGVDAASSVRTNGR
ncbi:hypothetical protein ACQY0O_005357 [Thecaphora frezii]